MQRMEIIIRCTDEEDQVLSESNMSFQTLDVATIPRSERPDQLESDTLDKGHQIMRHMFLSQCQLVDQQLTRKRQHSDADCKDALLNSLKRKLCYGKVADSLAVGTQRRLMTCLARRQKHQGMHWSLETSDSLCALKTLMLNRYWELYWQKREVIPLAAQAITSLLRANNFPPPKRHLCYTANSVYGS